MGTAGWAYAHWRGSFYPPDLPAAKYLAYYSAGFDTVEVNNSFYRLPPERTFRAWATGTPPGFVFALKASRYITHVRRLREPVDPIQRLLTPAGVLGDALGPIFFQLPPRFAPDLPRLEAFLRALPAGLRYAVEIRDGRWFQEPVYQLLRRYGVALCIHDLSVATLAPGTRPTDPGMEVVALGVTPTEVTADFVYVRLHGPGKDYTGDYPLRHLEVWANQVSGWAAAGLDVYLYFNNDPGGMAVKNARELKSLLPPSA